MHILKYLSMQSLFVNLYSFENMLENFDLSQLKIMYFWFSFSESFNLRKRVGEYYHTFKFIILQS